MSDQVKNFAYSTTTASVTDSATSFSVQSGHGSRFPATSGGAYNLVVWNPLYDNASVAYQNGAAEIVRVTTRANDTFSVITRAQEDTTAIAWGANWRVEMNVTAKNFTDLDLPTQTANSAKFLTTDGSTASWNYPKSKQFVYTGSIGSNATVYTIPSLGTNNSTEASVLTNFANNVAIRNLCLRVIGNAGASVTATIRKNTADTLVACTASGGGTASDTDDIATYEGVDGDADTFAIKLVSTASGFTVTATITFDLYYL